jgi:hypothetical protein
MVKTTKMGWMRYRENEKCIHNCDWSTRTYEKSPGIKVQTGRGRGGFKEGPNRNNILVVDGIDVAENTVQRRYHVSLCEHLMNLRVSQTS